MSPPPAFTQPWTPGASPLLPMQHAASDSIGAAPVAQMSAPSAPAASGIGVGHADRGEGWDAVVGAWEDVREILVGVWEALPFHADVESLLSTAGDVLAPLARVVVGALWALVPAPLRERPVVLALITLVGVGAWWVDRVWDAVRERTTLVVLPTVEHDPRPAAQGAWLDGLLTITPPALVPARAWPVDVTLTEDGAALTTLVSTPRPRAVRLAAASLGDTVRVEDAPLPEPATHTGHTVRLRGVPARPLSAARGAGVPDPLAPLAALVEQLGEGEHLAVRMRLLPSGPYAPPSPSTPGRGSPVGGLRDRVATGLRRIGALLTETLRELDVDLPPADEPAPAAPSPDPDKPRAMARVAILAEATAPSRREAAELARDVRDAVDGQVHGLTWTRMRSAPRPWVPRLSWVPRPWVSGSAPLVDVAPLAGLLSPATADVPGPVRRTPSVPGFPVDVPEYAPPPPPPIPEETRHD